MKIVLLISLTYDLVVQKNGTSEVLQHMLRLANKKNIEIILITHSIELDKIN